MLKYLCDENMILYMKQTLFDSSYRSGMIRKRLLQQVDNIRPGYLIISGCQSNDDKILNKLLEEVKKLGVNVITQNGKHSIDDHNVSLSDTHLLLNSKLISPIEGCVSVIESEPFSLKYVVLDIFADECFADYHGELDDKLIQELKELLSNSTK